MIDQATTVLAPESPKNFSTGLTKAQNRLKYIQEDRKKLDRLHHILDQVSPQS